MPSRIRFAARHFPGSPPALPAVGHIDVTWAELVWAAVCVGRWPHEVFRYGADSTWEVTLRAGVIKSSLREWNGSLVKSLLHEERDRSEKVLASYYIGMTCAKLIAAKSLGVPHLVHLDRYQIAYRVDLNPGSRTRPDLIGPHPRSGWLVAEAKGRSRGADPRALRDLVPQKRAVRIDRRRAAVPGGRLNVALCQQDVGDRRGRSGGDGARSSRL